MEKCRGCYSSKITTSTSIFDTDIAEIFRTLTNLIIIKGDGLPDVLCIECYDIIDKFKKFKIKCIETDLKYREFLPNRHDVKVSPDDCDTWDENIKNPIELVELKEEFDYNDDTVGGGGQSQSSSDDEDSDDVEETNEKIETVVTAKPIKRTTKPASKVIRRRAYKPRKIEVIEL